MPIGTQLFLVANGLSVAGAPYPRERFLSFAVLGGIIGLFSGVPAAMLLAISAVAVDAKATYERNDAVQRASVAGWRRQQQYSSSYYPGYGYPYEGRGW